MNDKTFPTAKEIDPYDSLDGQSACKRFLGKTLAEAEALFRENSIGCQEDLMWMGPIAFRYYVIAAIRYIESEAAAGDSDMINCFVGLLEFRHKYEETELIPVADQLVSICDYIIANYEKFDVSPGIYDDIRARAKILRAVFLSHRPSA